jgi:hypothetical protein
MRRSPAVCMSASHFSILILCLVILSSLSFAASADRISGPIVASQTVKVGGGTPLQARRASDEGPIDPSLTLSYITLLTSPSAAQQKELNTLYLNQQNPHSASFRKWLTPEQYADRFGLSNNDLNKITTWLQSQGFTIVRTARGRNFVVFSGTAALVERAFQTEIHSFTSNGETHFANITPASIPAALSGIVTGFHGLNNFRPKSQAQRGNPSYTFLYKGNDYYFVAPGDITAMYDVSTLQGLDGTGQSLAVVGQTGIYQSDLTNFRQNFGLSAISCTTSSDVITSCNTSNFKYVLVNGSATSISLNDLPESDLDLEWSGATAPKAQVIFVNSTDPNGNGVWDSWYYAVDNTVAKVITMSYTSPCELAEADFGTTGKGTFFSDELELQKANVEGITFLNSSGDTGAAECDYGNNFAIYGYATAYPASSQYVTGVGGTSIPSISPDEYSSTYWNSSNGTAGASVKGYVPEQPWNDAQEFGLLCTPSNSCSLNGVTVTSWSTAQTALGISGGGGGVSNCVTLDANGVCLSGFPQPSWQSGISASAINPSGFGVTNTPARYSPDISLLASPNFPGYLTCTQEAALGGSGSGSTCDSPSTGIADMLGACLAGTNACSIFGGTSVSTPVFAGMVTLLNQYLDVSGLGNINPTLYTLAAANATNQAFHPVTTGSTGSYSDGAFCQEGTPDSGIPSDPWPAALQCPSSGANAGFLGFNSYNADPTTGYNLVTGLGSVDADKLAVAWKSFLQSQSFTLSANPTSVSIAQGGAAGNTTITVTDLGGFTGNVSLAASNVPNGVTATFTPTSTSTTAILSLVASGSATPGTTTITITGTSGSATATTTVSLTVTGFTLSATSLQPIPQGTTGNSTITVNDVGGFNGNVSLTTSALPTGVSAVFNPASTTTTSVLTIAASAAAVPGTTTVTITGTSGSLSATTTVTLTVEQNFTVPPTLTAPANPEPGQSTTTTMLVSALGGGTFSSAVTFGQCSGLTGVTCTYNPASIASGSGPTTVTITIQTLGPFTGAAGGVRQGVTRTKLRSRNQRLWLPLSLPFAGIVLLGLGGRKIRRRYKIVGLCLALALAGFLVACGGGSSGPAPVTVTPATAQVQLGATQQFTASSSAVTWSVTGAGAVGTISASGLYTAPTTGTTPINFTVTATPTTGSAGTAAVTIPAVGVSVAPATVNTLYPSLTGAPAQTQQFTPTVTNDTANQNVTWSVTGGGTISDTGLYTAPATVPSGAVTVTSTSVADTSKFGTATVNIQTPTAAGAYPITVTVSEGAVQHTSGFTLTVVN